MSPEGKSKQTCPDLRIAKKSRILTKKLKARKIQSTTVRIIADADRHKYEKRRKSTLDYVLSSFEKGLLFGASFYKGTSAKNNSERSSFSNSVVCSGRMYELIICMTDSGVWFLPDLHL